MLNEIQSARKYLAKNDCKGENVCCSCGGPAEREIKQVLKSTFTDFPQLMQIGSKYICENCASLLDNSDMRFKIIFSDEKCKYQILDRPEVLQILKNPPKEFVLSVPYSFKKHHWLYAGLSTNKIAYIGTDSRAIVIDYQKNDIPQLIDNIVEYINFGVPRNEIISGNYSIFSMQKFDIKSIENNISWTRQSGLIELIVKYTPAVKSKIKFVKEDEIVLTLAEKNAISLLKLVASQSNFRKENGLQFWGGFFERRVNRFKQLPFNEFVSKLADATDSKLQGISEFLEMSEEECNEIMDVICKQTHLMVAMAYSEMKKEM